MADNYVLTSAECNRCVWGENGYYNAICAHCPYINYSKNPTPSFMTRQMAETLRLVKEQKDED